MNIYGLIGAAVGASALLGVVGRGLRRAYLWCKRLGGLLEQVNTRSTQLEPNSGSTMRDAVIRIEATLLQQNDHLRRQDAEIAELKQQSATIADIQSGRRYRHRPRW